LRARRQKAKTAVGIAVAYAEVVLALTTQPSELAADRMRNLLSDSLLVINTGKNITVNCSLIKQKIVLVWDPLQSLDPLALI